MGGEMQLSSENFYADLPGFDDFSAFADAGSYQPLPDDWFVVITDVLGSTRAIDEGRYKQVNALGAASIVALLNVCDPLIVPYVFGGDGATLCVPPSRKRAVESALVATHRMAEESFQLGLRIGMVPMQTILDHGHQVLVGKCGASGCFQQAMFTGGGLAHAEAMVKKEGAKNAYLIEDSGHDAVADFEGFQCRWREIPSPHEEVVAILVQALEHPGKSKLAIYSELYAIFTAVYGSNESHHPVHADLMRLENTLQGMETETGVQTAGKSYLQKLFYRFYLKTRTNLAAWIMDSGIKRASQWWGRYKSNFIANTDCRKFDDALRMVVSGSISQREQLTAYLQQQYEQGYLVYGLHSAKASLATCLVRDFNTNHVHFVDAANGGYALAARQMKTQLAGRVRDTGQSI